MKIIFMGTPDFAVPALEALCRSDHEVVMVVTQPDRQKGRGKAMAASSVKICAEKYDIPVFQPVRVKQPEAVEVLHREMPDLIVVAAYGQILSKEILDIPKHGCVNIHASLLPKYRGAAPIQWAVINGEKQSGVTIMQMDTGLDTGDMLLQSAVAIDEEETGESLYEKLSVLGGELLLEALPGIQNGTLQAVRQSSGEATYASMLRKEMGNINWKAPADRIESLARGLYPWPGAYTHYQGRLLKLWSVKAYPSDLQQEPGTVVAAGKEGIDVMTGKGILRLREVQIEGKKRLPAADFLLGTPLKKGEVLD